MTADEIRQFHARLEPQFNKRLDKDSSSELTAKAQMISLIYQAEIAAQLAEMTALARLRLKAEYAQDETEQGKIYEEIEKL